MANVKAVYAWISAYELHALTLERGVLPIEAVVLAKLAPTVREELSTYCSQFIVGDFREKGIHAHSLLNFVDGSVYCSARLGTITRYRVGSYRHVNRYSNK